MIDSLKIFLCFVLGILSGYFSILPEALVKLDLASYVLYVLLFLIGIGIGSNKNAIDLIKKINLKIVLVPISIIIGSAAGGIIVGLAVSDLGVRDSVAVSFGFGYYSLSSVIISKLKGETLGVIALLSNISRELFTLIATPVIVKLLGKLSPISSGGATTMDTTLPVIKKYSGEEYVIISFFSGITLTLIVPFLVSFVLSF